jgi:hypothetical protein
MTQYWFKTDLFQIEPGEDEEINPRIYGRQFARWLRAQLEAAGYAPEPVIAEDWGRCIVVSREPFRLWVGCGNVMDLAEPKPDDPPPSSEAIVWTCFAEAEVPLWKRLFNKPDTAPALARLNAALATLFAAEPRIRLVEEP